MATTAKRIFISSASEDYRTNLLENCLMRLIIIVGLMVFSANSIRGQWVQTNWPYPGAEIYALAVMDSIVFAGTNNRGVFRSNDNGNTWTSVNTGLPKENRLSENIIVTALAVSDSAIYAGATYEGVYRSTDKGLHWTSAGNMLYSQVWSLAVYDSFIYAGDMERIFFSTNGGISWTKGNNLLTTIFSFAFIGNDVFAGTRVSVVKATIGQAQWVYADSGITDYDIGALAVSGNHLYAGTSNGGIFLSTDSGTRWTPVNSGMPIDSKVSSLLVIDKYLFAGTYGSGIFRSTNNGANREEYTWEGYNSGLRNSDIYCLALCKNNVYAGTWGDGVWRRPLSEMVGVINPKSHKQPQTYSGFKLTVPFQSNRNVAINFTLADPEPITVKIYNVTGREITSLVHKHLGPGFHTVLWDTRNIAAGCYMVRMQAGSNSCVQKTAIVH
jgi:hypothetical protein